MDRKSRAIAALHDVAVAAGRLDDQPELAAMVVSRARVVAGGDAAVLRWFDAGAGKFRLLAADGAASDPASEIGSEEPTAIREAFTTGKPVIVNDYEASGQTTSWGRTHGLSAQVAVPLLVEGTPLGTLAVLSFGPRRFVREDARFLSLLAAVVAPALQASHLARQMKASEDLIGTANAILESEQQRLSVIIEAQRDIASSDLDLDRLLEVLSERTVALAGAGACVVLLPEGDELVARAAAGNPVVPLGFRLPMHGSLAGLAFRTGELQRASDAMHDERVHSPTARARSLGAMVSAPLVTEGRVIGVLQLVSEQPGALDETDVRTLEMFAAFAAAAFQRAATIARLKASERRVRAVMEAAPDPIVVFNAEGEIVELNPAGERSFGRSRDEAIGKTATLLLAPKHLEAFHRWSRAGAQANSAEYAGRVFEATGRRCDGSEFPMEIVVTDLPEETRLAAAFLRDLTLRDRLKESRERLASVVASAPVAFLACEADGTITLAEGSGLSVLSLTPADTVGKNLRELVRWDAAALALIDQLLAGASGGGRLHVAGGDVYVGVAASRITADDGAVTGVSVVLSDATARVRAEEALRQSEAKSRLMAMMNHEVRTPLNSILGFAHLLRDSNSGALTDKQLRYVTNIESSGNHLLDLVNESLDLARLDIDRVHMDLQEIPVVECMEQAAEQVRLLAGAKGLDLVVSGCGEVTAFADRRQLVQVLLNLLSNAIRHTHEGGYVALSCRPAQNDVLVQVADTGDGISRADQGRLFEEFFQAGNHAPGGVGLGLAISRRLVQVMGGSIEVESELGRGSTFTVRLRVSSGSGASVLPN
ncbi:MAG TPA: GAF domain-containing protein [Candidatus Dormibacteraeota bacterium]|nr:GAF domain-containing protein [Candidatus Dormibacteraeota bacterium]